MNRKIMRQFFKEEVDKVDFGLCPTCGKSIKITEFRDEISVKEYGISGMCQKCQDKIFGGGV